MTPLGPYSALLLIRQLNSNARLSNMSSVDVLRSCTLLLEYLEPFSIWLG